jgi:hypothetical protein
MIMSLFFKKIAKNVGENRSKLVKIAENSDYNIGPWCDTPGQKKIPHPIEIYGHILLPWMMCAWKSVNKNAVSLIVFNIIAFHMKHYK